MRSWAEASVIADDAIVKRLFERDKTLTDAGVAKLYASLLRP